MVIRTSPPRKEVLESKFLLHLNIVYPMKFILELLISSESQIFVSKNLSCIVSKYVCMYGKRIKFECKLNNFDLRPLKS